MSDIHVIFPAKGEVVVSSETHSVLQAEYVNWHVYCQNPKVKKVRILFDDATATFFPGGRDGKASHEVEKEASDGCTIWGRAPEYRKSLKRDKYTVQGLDARGRIITALDPELITNDPKHH
jgi:hypothetical protein